MKDVVFLKFTDVKSFLVVKEYIYIYIYITEKRVGNMEKLKNPLLPRDIICDVRIQRMNLKGKIPNVLCILFYFHN